MGSRDKCYCGESTHCTKCSRADNCQLKRILCDANVIAAAFLQEKEQAVVSEFLQNNRRKHCIVITKEILGEIIWALVTKSGNEQLAEANVNEFLGYLKNFIVESPPYNKMEFMNMLNRILESSRLRCGYADRMHISNAIFAKIKFCTLEEKIREDSKTVNAIVSGEGHKFELYSLS